MTAAEITDAKQAIAELRLPFDLVRDAPLPRRPARPPRRSARHDARGARAPAATSSCRNSARRAKSIRRWWCLPTFPAR